MKAYCENCGIHEASFRPGNDAKSGEPFEDLCCDGCHLVLATVSEREGGYSERPHAARAQTIEALSAAQPQGEKNAP